MRIIVFLDYALAVFLLSKEYMDVLLYVMSAIALQMVFYTGNTSIYSEVFEDYPNEECIKPEICEFLFRGLNEISNKGVPKEIYYSGLIEVGGFLIYSIVFVYLFLFSTEYIAGLAGFIYIGFVVAVQCLSFCIMTKKRFLARYKRLTRHNFKFLFIIENVPDPRLVGRCRIDQKYKIGKRTLVTVTVLQTGEKKDKVLLQGNKTQEENLIYDLYEICDVYYIT